MKRLANKPEARDLARRVKLPCGPLSYSQISTYMLCPRSYYFQYIMRVQRVGWAENLTLGSVAHKGLETLLLQKQFGNTIARSVMLTEAYRAMDTALQHDMTIAKVSKSDVAYIKRQNDCLKKLIDVYADKHLPKIIPTGVEKVIWVVLGGIPVVLKIDLVHDDVRVTDFKLTRRNKSEYDAMGSLQLSMYAAGLEIPNTSFVSLKFPDLTKKTAWKPTVVEVKAKKKSGDASWTEDVVASLARAIIRDSQENCEEAFMLCDPGSWKCSPKMCDWWPMCRGADRDTRREMRRVPSKKPGWIGPLFGDWNELGGEQPRKENKQPDWLKKTFTDWNEL